MKTTLVLPFALSLLSWLGAVRGASAQSFSIDWHAVSGGGGTSADGPFTLSGTIGQAEADPQTLTGGAFSLTGGFWSLFAVPTPGAPLLAIERQGAGVRVVWPRPAAGFVLDQGPTVTGLWSQVPFPYVTNATEISIHVPALTGGVFYRLRRP